ncbi:MAG: VWA domain-containing protein [Acidobacteria bacterium]|nr:VWA domain-containing protein [Acidobacteriota bacterium]
MILFCLSLWVQDDPQMDLVESMSVEYVMLDVFAHNPDGSPVVDLQASDFRLKEDKKDIKFEIFQVVDYRFAPPQQEFAKMQEEADPDNPVQVFPQTFILVLEFSMADTNQVRSTVEELKQYFQTAQVRPNVNFFVVSLEHGRITSDFTNQPSVVYQQLLEYEKKLIMNPGGNLMVNRETKLSFLESELNDCTRFITGFNSGGGDVFGAENDASKTREYNDCITLAHDRFLNMHAAHTKGILAALESLTMAFARVPGMKSIYFVSPGFSLRPGSEAASLTRSYADRMKAGSYVSSNQSQGAAPTPAHIATSNLTREFMRIAHAATANRMVFHTFRSGGQTSLHRMGADGGVAGLNEDTSLHFDAFSEEMNKGLSYLAETTGGEFVPESPLGPSLQRVLDNHSLHYVLGYPKPSGRKKFRSIKVTCNREDVKLSYRSGYYPDPKKAK